MKIVWRNPNSIDRTSFLIVKTLAVEQPDELRVFYRSSRGSGALGTIFELLVNRNGVSRAASSKCHPFGFFFNAHTFATSVARSFTPLRARKESQLRCKGKSVVREDGCFADMEVAVESSPVPA